MFQKISVIALILFSVLTAVNVRSQQKKIELLESVYADCATSLPIDGLYTMISTNTEAIMRTSKSQMDLLDIIKYYHNIEPAAPITQDWDVTLQPEESINFEDEKPLIYVVF